MKRWLAFLFAAVLCSLTVSGVMAQDEETTIAVAESDELGQYLTDAAGMTL